MAWQFHAYFWPAFWILFWAGRSALRHRRRMAELQLQMQHPMQVEKSTSNDEKTELVDLRERVKVLERITVDERHSRELAAEIESLRDR